MNESYIFITIFCILILLVLVGLSLNYRILHILRKKHPEVWSHLGSPSLLLNSSINSNTQLLKFLYKKKYLKYNDAELNMVGGLLRIFNFVFIIFFIIIIVAIGLSMFGGISFLKGNSLVYMKTAIEQSRQGLPALL